MAASREQSEEESNYRLFYPPMEKPVPKKRALIDFRQQGDRS